MAIPLKVKPLMKIYNRRLTYKKNEYLKFTGPEAIFYFLKRINIYMKSMFDIKN